jgi:hypothetical protein
VGLDGAVLEEISGRESRQLTLVFYIGSESRALSRL